MDVFSIRASSVGELFDCPKRWSAKYIDKLFLPTSPSAQLGTAIHAACGLWDQESMREDSALEIEDCIGVLCHEIDTPQYEVDWGKTDKDEFKRIGESLVRRYIAEVSPHFMWMAVEAKCQPIVFEDLGLELTGSTDRVYKDEQGRLGIADLKTGKSAVGTDGKSHAEDYKIQLGCYELLAYQTTGEQMTAPAVVIGLQTGKTAAAQRVGLSSIDGSALMLIGDEKTPGLLQLASRLIQTGVFYPNSKSNFCTSKMCPAYPTCAYK